MLLRWLQANKARQSQRAAQAFKGGNLRTKSVSNGELSHSKPPSSQADPTSQATVSLFLPCFLVRMCGAAKLSSTAI